MYVCMYKWQGIEVVGGQETGDEVAWAPLYDEQFKIDQAEGKYKYPGIDAPLVVEEDDE